MLTQYMKFGIAAAAITVAIGAWLYVNGLQKDVTRLNRELNTCVTQGNILSQKIVEQNKAIDVMHQETLAREKASALLIAAAKMETAQAKKKANVIYKISPSTPGNDCKSSLDLINTESVE